MLSSNRFALPPTLLPLPCHSPVPTPNHHPNPNPRRSSFRQKPAGPQIPRRRGRPPKRRLVTDSSASPPAPSPQRRGRGRPRKNPETKAPTPPEPATVGELVPRPRLIIRLRSKPPSPNVDGSELQQRMPLPAIAHSILPRVQSEPENDEALLPLVLVRSEPDVEMLQMDQMQPEPEGGLLLLQPEPEFLLRALEQPENNEGRSLPTSAKLETKQNQSLPAAIRPESVEESSPPAVEANVESPLPASLHLEPEPRDEQPLALARLHIEAKELKEESLSISTTRTKSNETGCPQVSVHPDPWKEELLQLLPQLSETEVDLFPLLDPEQSELHEEPILSISTQAKPEEQLSLPEPLRMELIEITSQLAPEQTESFKGTLVQPELDEEYLPPAQLLLEPKEEPLLLPSIRTEPEEELLPLASIEPEVKEESSPPAPIPAVEKGEKSGNSSKQRRTHAKHRRLWFEC